ncbi:fungal-specific transcription factor domain-containing protein [Roridomyces roridus]|uniref:Fungal-specific transcription factor domain-containing protein n=1 Tax=Roridomyces roridus TaxID=1738132 RepID=A0AAD7C6T9_9AGAR|nr:fungal-specific transcription factor domain-containing protein [Roridomyces roridus]
MSSSDDDNEHQTSKKQKRVQRACDMCRRKKRRCDGGEVCAHCSKHNFICTYIEPSAFRLTEHDGADGSSSTPTKSYIEALEARLKTVEALLAKANSQRSPGVQLVSNAIQRLNNPFPIPTADDLTFVDIEASFRALDINNTAAQGFQGKSSGAMLVKAAIDLRNKKRRQKMAKAGLEMSNFIALDAPSSIKTWEAPIPPPRRDYLFPDPDLLDALIRLYFSNVNAFLPLLHRPTFEAAVYTHKLHETHGGFAKVLLLVCAVGARYSTDPRVSLSNTSPTETAGWKWFDQVELSGHLVNVHPTLYDLQSYCLAAEFLDCTSSPRACWTLVGFGMRLSQDIGAHRFKMREHMGGVTFEQELEKRASWVLFLFDAQISTALGRCIALQSHDFDLELPLTCDDEYWGSPGSTTPLFRQPPEIPSKIAFFKCMLQLNRILSFSCKILYSTNRSKLLIGLGDDKWEEQIVVELDSALNTWFETIPEHLRWDPNNLIEDPTFFDQSAILHCTYYHTRIIIHRPFIPAMRRAANPTHLPSLAICNTAARACSHVAQIQQQRRPKNPLWFSQTPLFTSGIVLLLNIWGSGTTGTGRVKAAERDLEDVHRCMAVLDAQRQQWPSAGALLDTLRQLVAVDPPQPAPSPAPSGSIEQEETPPSPPAPMHHAVQQQLALPAPALPQPSYVETDIPPMNGNGMNGNGNAGEHHVELNDVYSTPLPMSPPRYDPVLETAPPDMVDDMWFDGGGAQVSVQQYNQAHGYANGYVLDPPYYPGDAGGGGGYEYDVGYPQPGQGHGLGPYVIPVPYIMDNGGGGTVGGGYEMNERWELGDGDVQMQYDTDTVELWARAPTGFGVADWDMYLGQFGEYDAHAHSAAAGQHAQVQAGYGY